MPGKYSSALAIGLRVQEEPMTTSFTSTIRGVCLLGLWVICFAAICSKDAAFAQANTQSSIPLCPGLTIVTAVHQQNGDYESIKTVESVGPKDVRLKYSAESANTDWLTPSKSAVKTVNLQRIVLAGDLESAKAYQQVYLDKSDETIPGTTAIGISTAVLRGLKSKGEADLAISNAYGGLQLTADKTKRPNYYDYLQTLKLKRVGGPIRLPVIVNDAPSELAAVHAEAESVGDKMDFYFLDNENNPLTLAFRIGIGALKPLTSDQMTLCKSVAKAGAAGSAFLGDARCDMPNGGDRDTLRVVKLNSRCSGPAVDVASEGRIPGGTAPGGSDVGSTSANALEKALADNGTVDVYSIYFSFNSDGIRDESQPTLKDIVEVLHRHPAWKLKVDGHTDNIGGDEYNLALSKRRAAAVKDALVKQYHIEAGRLVTDGYGASRPKDTNDTLEGRARNRRVELVKIG
jgi:outer membrane protein OmpA-like peptidoglycan-associated protein